MTIYFIIDNIKQLTHKIVLNTHPCGMQYKTVFTKHSSHKINKLAL